MKWLALVCLLGLTACGGIWPTASLITDHGASVELNGNASFDGAQADTMESWYILQMTERGYFTRAQVLKAMRSSHLVIYDHLLACPWASKNGCAGLEEWSVLKLYDFGGCTYATAYLHELTHYMLALYKGDSDPTHSELKYWNVGDGFPERCSEPK